LLNTDDATVAMSRGRVSKPHEFPASLAEAIERHKALRGAGRRADRDSKAA
jgi:hypothetical protein